jgi:hypothetical protein
MVSGLLRFATENTENTEWGKKEMNGGELSGERPRP